MSETTVTDVPDRSRFELRLGEEVVGHIAYRRDGDVLDLHHTEIADDHEGEGLGGRLVRGVLDDVRARGLRVVPTCPFVKGWIDKHPDEAALVA